MGLSCKWFLIIECYYIDQRVDHNVYFETPILLHLSMLTCVDFVSALSDFTQVMRLLLPLDSIVVNCHIAPLRLLRSVSAEITNNAI